MDGHFGPDCRECPSSYFGKNCVSICTCNSSNDVQCHYVCMHKSKRYVDVLKNILRQTLNKFHSSLELIGPVFYDTLNR